MSTSWATSDPTRHAPLPALVVRIFIGFSFSALGSGLTLPFLYVYLAEVRDLPTTTVGLLFAWMGVVGLTVSPMVGSLIDRIGPRPVMLVGLIIEAAAVGSLGWIESAAQMAAVAAVMVLGQTSMWPATSAMLTRLVPEADRERVYGVQFLLLNAGLGLGGLLAALVIDLGSVESFQRLYLIDAASYLAFIVVVVSLPAGTGRAVPEAGAGGSGEEEAAGWSVVLRDRALLRVLGLAAVALTFGYAQFEAGFAAYAVDVAEVPARALGLAYAANTGAIVLGQLLMLRYIGGRRRSTLLAVCTGIWAVSWVVIAFSDAVGGVAAVLLIVVGLGLFGIGETIWAPVAPAVVNGLAPEELRGRYNAAFAMVWTLGAVIGPAMGGMMIGHGVPHLWIGTLVVGMAASTVAFARLRKHLTDRQDGVTD